METIYNLIFDIHLTSGLWVGLGIFSFIFLIFYTFKSAKIDFGLLPIIFGPFIPILLLVGIFLIGTNIFTTAFNISLMVFIYLHFSFKNAGVREKRKKENDDEKDFDNKLKIIENNLKNITNSTKLEDIDTDYIDLLNSAKSLRYPKEYLISNIVYDLYKQNNNLGIKVINILYPKNYREENKKLNNDSKSDLFNIFEEIDRFYKNVILYEFDKNEDLALSMVSSIKHPRHRSDIYKSIVEIFYEYDDEGFKYLNMITDISFKNQYKSEHKDKVITKKNIIIDAKRILYNLKFLKTELDVDVEYNIDEKILKNLEYFKGLNSIDDIEGVFNFYHMKDKLDKIEKKIYFHLIHSNKEKTLFTTSCPHYPIPFPSYITSSSVVFDLNGFRTWKQEKYDIKNVICLMTNDELDKFYLNKIFSGMKSSLFISYEESDINYIHFPINDISELNDEKLKEIKKEYSKFEGNTIIHKLEENEITDKVFNYLTN